MLTGPLVGNLGTHLSHMQILVHSSSKESSLSDSVSNPPELLDTSIMLRDPLLVLSFMLVQGKQHREPS